MQTVKRIAIGSDHNGYQHKEAIKKDLQNDGYTVVDFGQFAETPPARDYSMAEKVSDMVSKKEMDGGILICGSGVGMCIVANKIPNCYAALCSDLWSVENARKRNNANILVMGAKIVPLDLAKEIVRLWLHTEFEDGKSHERNIERLNQLMKLDRRYRRSNIVE